MSQPCVCCIPYRSSTTETFGGVRYTTTNIISVCGFGFVQGSISPPAFNPSGMLTLKFRDDLVLDWTQVSSINRVVVRYFYEKVVAMDAPKHRRVLRTV